MRDESRKSHTVRDVAQTSGKHHIFTMSPVRKQRVDWKSRATVMSNPIYSRYYRRLIPTSNRHGIERNASSEERDAV